VVKYGAVIDEESFGFASSGSKICEISQVGKVEIKNDDIEIGTNPTIDRTAVNVIKNRQRNKNWHYGPETVHNVQIGESIIAAQVGISRSMPLGNNVTMAG
jgi:UDP-3-O-[3-hydroxymyristoyl] glucosamine N-acyltransferase